MKKWFEYQLKNTASKDRDWDKFQYPEINIMSIVGDIFDKIKTDYYNVKNTLEIRSSLPRNHIDSIKNVYGVDATEWFADEQYAYLTNHPSYRQWIIDDDVLKQKMADTFNLKFDTIEMMLNVMEPGFISYLHIDRHKIYESKKDISKRYLIFMDDWQYGQLFQVGENMIKWKAGDSFLIDEGNVPHGGANIGFEDRFLLRVTGKLPE